MNNCAVLVDKDLLGLRLSKRELILKKKDNMLGFESTVFHRSFCWTPVWPFVTTTVGACSKTWYVFRYLLNFKVSLSIYWNANKKLLTDKGTFIKLQKQRYRAYANPFLFNHFLQMVRLWGLQFSLDNFWNMSFKFKKQWKVMKYQVDKTIKCVSELLKKPQ